MALVMLPCDLPWWDALQNLIKNLASAQNVDELISGMGAIFTMCNVGLDPDETYGANPQVLIGLKTLLSEDFTDVEREHFFKQTLTIIIKSALDLKSVKPVDGLKFSLQQEASVIEMKHDFACSLIAHAFLSTFPKRTHKTHPSLQDFNFTFFHRHLNQNSQKLKLRSIFHYFNLQSKLNVNSVNSIKIMRQVMKSSYRLAIEDWLRCDIPLCSLNIKHDNHMDNATDLKNPLFVCFSSIKLGGRVLSDGASMECIRFVTSPELLTTLLFVEALQDNEALIIENLFTVGKINISKLKENFEPADSLKMLSICCVDAQNYKDFPTSQYESNSLLRELNKALLGFHREQFVEERLLHPTTLSRRLSPIGESLSITPTELYISPPNKSKVEEEEEEEEEETNLGYNLSTSEERCAAKESFSEQFFASRLPLTIEYSTCSSEEGSSLDEFYSTKTSLTEYDEDVPPASEINDNDDEDSDEKESVRRYSSHLDTTEHRRYFAEQLRKALCQSPSVCSKNSSYAVDISVTGSSIGDPNIRMKRGGSWGFALEENPAFDDDDESHISPSARKRNGEIAAPPFITTNEANSSRYSFSTDDTNFEDIYEELIRWLDEQSDSAVSSMILNAREEDEEDGGGGGGGGGGKPRNAMIVRFAASLLKRTLSESFVGIPLTEEGADGQTSKRNAAALHKVRMLARSLSLQLAKHKHKLAGELLPAAFTNANNSRPSPSNNKEINSAVLTGNWGCGSRNSGNPQLKLLIQWLAGSVASVSQIVYYTRRNSQLLKLDTVCRVLVDRRWNVGELLTAIIQCIRIMRGESRNSNSAYDSGGGGDSLFDLLLITAVNENILYS